MHALKKETKKKRAMNKLVAINTAWAKEEVEDKMKGHAYQSRMTAPTVTATTEEVRENDEGVVVAGTAPYCGACGNFGHQRQTHLFCTQNPRSKNYQGKYVD